MNTTELLAQGLLGLADAAVQIRDTLGDPNSSAGGRTISVTLAGGLSLEVLTERGLDIGAAWAGGQPLAWRAPLHNPGLAPTPADWLGRFGGGLLTTCGLDNIGAPRDGYGQHGSHHDTRAADVSWTRLPAGPTSAPGVLISGVIDSVETFGRTVRVYREIESRCDAASVTIRDTIVNEGHAPAPVAVLYHINLGAPLVLPGTRIDIPAAQHLARENVRGIPDWQLYPDPLDTITEAVWSHERLQETEGRARASIASPAGARFTLEWTADALPRCIEWIFPTRGRWALGIEPANAPLIGHEREAVNAGAPVLQPGEVVRTELRCTWTAAP